MFPRIATIEHMCESLSLFSEPTKAWFEHAFGQPTEAQAQAWPAIHSGRNVLVIAPTGSGKTLAAFLSAIDRLMTVSRTRRAGVRVLYVSPLKALAVDVAKNLEQPLEGIAAQCEAQGLPAPKIAVANRSGDTTTQERRRIASHPPDILVTTPESLYLLLTSKAGRILGTVDTVIVDEIHAVAGTKRGSHLALSLERLENLVAESRRRDAMDRNDGESKVSDDSGNEPLLQRIGLSATVNPPEEAARFLTGGRPVTIVNPGGRPAMDLRMVEPLENMRDLQSVNAKQRVGGVDSERPTPHISGVTPAMQRLAERKGIAQTGDSGLSAGGNGVLVGGEAGAGGDGALLSGERTTGGAFDSAVLVGAAGDRTSGSIWPVVERSVLDEILAHRTTLVFVNSRGVAEKLTARLNDLYAQTRHEVDPDLVRDMGSPEGREGFASHYDAVVGSTTMLVGSHEAMTSSPWPTMVRSPKSDER
mgnify:FL=1